MPKSCNFLEARGCLVADVYSALFFRMDGLLHQDLCILLEEPILFGRWIPAVWCVTPSKWLSDWEEMDPKLEGGQGETWSAWMVVACSISWVGLQYGPLFSLHSSLVSCEEFELIDWAHTVKVQGGKRVKPIWNWSAGIEVPSSLSPVPVKSYDPWRPIKTEPGHRKKPRDMYNYENQNF